MIKEKWKKLKTKIKENKGTYSEIFAAGCLLGFWVYVLVMTFFYDKFTLFELFMLSLIPIISIGITVAVMNLAAIYDLLTTQRKEVVKEES